MPGVGYDHPNQSHFTSRHFWEVGRARRQRPDRLDGPLPRPPRRRRQPAAGPGAGLRRWRPRSRRRTSRSPPSRTPEDYALLGARRLGRRGSSTMLSRLRPRSAALPTTDPSSPARARRRGMTRRCSDAARAAPGPTRHAAARRLPDDDDLPAPAGRAGGDARGRLPLRCVAVDAPRRLRHARQPGGSLPDDIDAARATLAAFQRDLEARGLADRVLVHVWTRVRPPRARRTAAGTDHGAAGVAC